jgi:hypothetical protein
MNQKQWRTKRQGSYEETKKARLHEEAGPFQIHERGETAI